MQCACASAPPPDREREAASAREPEAHRAPAAVVDVALPPPSVASGDLRVAAVPMRATGAVDAPDLRTARRVSATIQTDLGSLRCELLPKKAPVTVENFVGLATGKKQWRDPRSGLWSNEPAYDGTSFHRIIPGFMIQGGDRKGDGTGEPGFVIDDEIWPGAKHDRAGLLCMANRGKDTNGSQFFITDASAPHLDGGYTIFGECSPIGVVHEIANVPTGPGGRPHTEVRIHRVTIEVE